MKVRADAAQRPLRVLMCVLSLFASACVTVEQRDFREKNLIEIAYAFEQASQARKPPLTE